MNGVNPESFHFVEADRVWIPGKAAREDRILARSNSSTGDYDLRHVYKGTFVNLGDPPIPRREKKSGKPGTERPGDESKGSQTTPYYL